MKILITKTKTHTYIINKQQFNVKNQRIIIKIST